MQPTPKKTVMKMRQAYDETIRKTSTESLRIRYPDRPWIEEAASTWVSRKDLNALLDANNADGLRIYYGCHYESTDSDPRLDYLGLHNLVFVATKDSVDAQNPKTETSVDQLKDKESMAKSMEGVTDNYEDMAGDLTPLCPPTCPLPE